MSQQIPFRFPWTTDQLKQQFDRAVAAGYLPDFEAAAAPFKDLGIDVALLMADASRESQISNILGDHGHGHGMMQLDDRWHQQWLALHKDGLDPASNLAYAAQQLAGFIKQEGGSIHKGLAAYNAGPGNVAKALRAGLADEAFTAGHNYASDVLARQTVFAHFLAEVAK